MHTNILEGLIYLYKASGGPSTWRLCGEAIQELEARLAPSGEIRS
jgi:hypothetical protein